MEIREASIADWDDIFPIFSAIVEAGQSYALPLGLTSEEARPWWMESPPGRTVVAFDGVSLLGTAKMGPNRPGRGSHIATASFMVNPEFERQGVGHSLGVHVIEWARAAGYVGIQFNAVVESNIAAVRAWEKLGFRVLTTVPQAFDHREYGLVGLHVMFLELRPE
ncbi:MAG TPA: GNAT family N-acetyltransferase [Acidimicrobiales bacterium]